MLDIIVPIFNEGEQIIKLFKLFEQKMKIQFSVYLCYDTNEDNVFDYKEELANFKFPINLMKNISTGPCSAVVTGLKESKSDCKIVYPADDFINVELLNTMYKKFLDNNADIVVASRFVKGGAMTGCPIIKSILIKLASNSLNLLSSIPVKDASNGFRLFSRRLINAVKIESKKGFAYSLELLVKCNRLKFKISEIPAIWVERCEGSSRFKIFKWLPQYLKWYFYGLGTTWLKKGPEKV